MWVKNLLKGLLLVPFACMGVCLDGFWQAETPEVSDTYIHGYSFKGNQFAFVTSGYDTFNPIFSLIGTFEICGDSIVLRPECVQKKVFEKVERDPMLYTTNDAWGFIGDEFVIDSLQNQEPIALEFKMGGDSIMLDRSPFYRIEGQKPIMRFEDY